MPLWTWPGSLIAPHVLVIIKDVHQIRNDFCLHFQTPFYPADEICTKILIWWGCAASGDNYKFIGHRSSCFNNMFSLASWKDYTYLPILGNSWVIENSHSLETCKYIFAHVETLELDDFECIEKAIYGVEFQLPLLLYFCLFPCQDVVTFCNLSLSAWSLTPHRHKNMA